MKALLKYLCVSLLMFNVFVVAQEQQSKTADMVIFSYNRPIQLYLLLESIRRYMTGIGDMYVIYRASDDAYASAYSQVQKEFPGIHFIMQGKTPRKDFKPLTERCTFGSPNQHIIFAVDDIVVKDSVNLSECIALLEATDSYGFYLRMGKNLTQCYTLRCGQPLPHMTEIKPGILSWRFADGQHDWRYPNTVDMTLYRKKDIEHGLKSVMYDMPNSLEGGWAGQANQIMQKRGLCFETSKIVNIPLNRVQNWANNRHMDFMTPQELLAKFMEGLKIDLAPLHLLNNCGAHEEYTPTFITR